MGVSYVHLQDLQFAGKLGWWACSLIGSADLFFDSICAILSMAGVQEQGSYCCSPGQSVTPGVNVQLLAPGQQCWLWIATRLELLPIRLTFWKLAAD